jgi:hypothetical protein
MIIYFRSEVDPYDNTHHPTADPPLQREKEREREREGGEGGGGTVAGS